MYRNMAMFFLIWMVMMIFSCASIRQELIQKPELRFENMELRNMSLHEAVAVFKFRIANPNPISLSIRNIAYDLNISNKKFIKGISDKDLRVRAAGNGSLELPITVSFADISESFENSVETDKMGYQLSGTMDVGPFTVPYRTKGNLNMPKLLKLSLKTVRVLEISNTYASVVFELEMENSNHFVPDLKSLNYSIRLGGKEFASGISENIFAINAKSRSKAELSIKIDFFRQGQSLAAILNESSCVYEISGIMTIDDPKHGVKNFPFRRAGSVPIVRPEQQ